MARGYGCFAYVERSTPRCIYGVFFQLRCDIVPELGRKGSTSAMHVRYTQDHQYIIVEDGIGTVGITKYAQEKLVEVTVVELPHIGAQVQKGGAVGVC